MKKLFIQFYLLLFVCFLVMSLLVGLVYKFTAERAGKQSLDDLMNSSLYLMRSELREIPPHDWGKTLKEMDLNLSFDLRVEPLSKYHLDEISMHRLRAVRLLLWMISTLFCNASHAATTCWPSVPFLISITSIKCVCWISR